jgi:hypothetical protein
LLCRELKARANIGSDRGCRVSDSQAAALSGLAAAIQAKTLSRRLIRFVSIADRSTERNAWSMAMFSKLLVLSALLRSHRLLAFVHLHGERNPIGDAKLLVDVV